MWSWIPLKPSLRSAYPLIGSAASADGVMSTLAAPAWSAAFSACNARGNDAITRRTTRTGQIIMIISPDLECHSLHRRDDLAQYRSAAFLALALVRPADHPLPNSCLGRPG